MNLDRRFLISGKLLFSLLMTSIGAFAGAQIHLPPPPEGHREYKQDPPRPRPPAPPNYSRGGIVTWGSFVSVQVNVDAQGQNIPNDAANEPSIAVNPLNPNNMVIGWRQFDSITSNFRQAGYAYTFDGGATWTFPGVLQPGVFRSDPVLDAGPNGVIYYYSLKSDFYCDVFRSFDGGVTWQGPIPAIGGDKEWMIVDNTQSPGRGFMYVAWSTAGNNYGGRQFTRSTDGGNTFGGPWFLDPNRQVWGTLATNAEGDLFVSGLRGNNFYLSKSINAKFAAQTPTFDLNVQVNLGGTANVSGRSPNPGGLVGQVWVAVDKSGTPLHGNVYMLCSADPPGTDPLDVMFARSEDGGATWSAPVRVNNDPQGSGRWQWFGTMSVAPNGRIDVVWNDTRNTLQATRCQTFYAFSWDGGRTWSVNIPMTPIWDSTVGWPNQNKIGDYYHMVSDNVSAHLAYAATFNNEQDVYYLRITPPAPLTPLEFSMFRGLVTGGGLSDLFASDNAYLTLRPGFVLNVNEAPIQIIVKGQAGSTTAQQFGLLLERRSSVTNISENVQFFDFSTNQWVSMNTSAMPTADNILHVSTTTNPSRFIHPTTREIRAKLEYRATGVVLTYPWFIFLDRVNWIIVP